MNESSTSAAFRARGLANLKKCTSWRLVMEKINDADEEVCLGRRCLMWPKLKKNAVLCKKTYHPVVEFASSLGRTLRSPRSRAYSPRVRLRVKDDNGSGSNRISADFGFTGFGFGLWFSPTDFRVRIPKILRVWGGFSILPADHHSGPKTIQPTRSPLATLGI